MQVSKADDSIGPEVAEKAKAMGNGEVCSDSALPCLVQECSHFNPVNWAWVSSVTKFFPCFKFRLRAWHQGPFCHQLMIVTNLGMEMDVKQAAGLGTPPSCMRTLP